MKQNKLPFVFDLLIEVVSVLKSHNHTAYQ